MAEVFGPYRLIRRLAQGGMGEVWLAVLEREGGFQKTVALKTMLPALATRAGFAEQFEAEAALAARLNHANIAQVFDHGTCEGRSYITMEVVEGPDLAALLAADGAGPLPPAVAAEIARQACRGLAHAHTRRDLHGRPVGLVHGDVSPSNVLLSSDGQVKLVDFGLASLRGASETNGLISGKFSYMSPEQARGEALGPKSDLFSLGLVLYEMLAGQRAYPLADPPADTLPAIRAGSHRPLTSWGLDLPAALLAVVDRTLQLDPAHRFASAAEMGLAIEQACPACGPDELSGFIARRAADHLAAASMPEPTEVAARPVGPDKPAHPPAAPRVRAGWWLAILFAISWSVGFAWWALHDPPAPRPAPPSASLPLAPTALQAKLLAERAGVDPAPAPGPTAAPVRSLPHVRVPIRKAKVAPVPDGGVPAAADADSPRLAQNQPRPRVALTFGSDLSARLDHRPVTGRLVSWSDAAAHLIALGPADGGPPQIQIRIAPDANRPGSWRGAVRATPWMRIRLDGRELGQTPRSGLRLEPGRRRLVLHRDGRAHDLILTLDDPPGGAL